MKRFLLIFFALMGTFAYGQDSRGSISGQVTDPTDAVIQNALVTITSTDTGAVTHVATRSEGLYNAPDLSPGDYSISVAAPGFKTYETNGIHISTQQNVTINVKLTIGVTSQVMNVVASTPLIDTADASTGQVLTTEEVQDLPNDGRSPLGFARIEYGAVSKGKHALEGSSPVGNSTVTDFSLGGGNSASNEILLDGVPNMEDSARTAGFSPNLDAVTEVRVDVFGANVTYGDTSGGTVNMTTKSGTNKFHGSASEFYQAAGCSGLNSTTFASRSANGCSFMAALPYTTPVGNKAPAASHINQFGGTIGGPVWIPRVFDGHNKLFFFYAYEGYVGSPAPAQTIGTVPTAAERTGDFSALLALGTGYQLYNPFSAKGTTSNFTRTAITGNVLSNAGLSVSPIAAAYLQMVPLPNYNGATTKADGENNYFAFTSNPQDYRSHQGRIDYNIGSKDKIYGKAFRSKYLNTASNYFHNSLTGTVTDQIHAGGMVEEVHTFSPSLFLDNRGSVTRYDITNAVSSTGISPTSVGLPSYVASNSNALALPTITFSDFSSSPLNYSNQPGTIENYDTVQYFSTLTWSYKTHIFLIGTDLRANKASNLKPLYADGQFTFTGSGKGNPVTASNSATVSTFGDSLALFMLGLPTGGTQNIGAPFQNNSWLDAAFLQDDWKPRPNLTVSMGMRFEHEIPVNESQNRMVAGFNPNATNAATVGAEANYAAAPSSLLPAASFLPTGGAIYASSSLRHPYHTAPLYFSPRVGISWAPNFLTGKGVIRLGYGIYSNPFNDSNFGQTYGYATTTTFAALDATQMIPQSISDPFPTATNPIQQPTGNALGVNADLGTSMVYYPSNVKVPYSERLSVDVQYQIGKSILIDLGYLHNHQIHLSYANNVAAIPLLPYLSRSAYYDYGVTNLLGGTTQKTGGPASTNIANPFLNIPGVTASAFASPLNKTLLAPSQFLQSNPEYTSVTEQLVPGSSSNYNALNARVAKTMGHGLTLNGVFEWSRLLGTFNQLNQGDVLNYGETTSDYPFHLSAYGTYQLPFGQGRQFFNQNRYLTQVIGGWQVSAIYQFLSGTPISWGNAIYTGSGWKDFHNKQHSSANWQATPVFNTAAFDTRVCTNPIVAPATTCNNDPSTVTAANPLNPSIQPTSVNYRTFPQYLMRQDYTSNWDANVQKDITTYENIKIQLRLDAFNLLNRPQYNTPNVSPTSALFGTTTGVYTGTASRQLDVGAHIIW
jgi:hypothetical protein